MTRSWRWTAAVAAILALGTSARVEAQEATVKARPGVSAKDIVSKHLSELRDPATAAVWVGPATGLAFGELSADVIMPTASAVKTFYLVELFAAHSDQLDKPLSDAADILKDNHPAISHFPPAVREEIRRELIPASARRVGEIMMGKTSVPNAVYNAAANLVTAHLGGPEKLTAAIHARDPRFSSVMVRRYMLRDRTMPGDNEAHAGAFAALYQSLATRSLQGIDGSTMTALHDVLRKKRDAKLGEIYEKDGGLSTDPLTAVKAGWTETASGPVVFVVMCRQSTADDRSRTEAYAQLRSTSVAIRDDLILAGQRSLTAAARTKSLP